MSVCIFSEPAKAGSTIAANGIPERITIAVDTEFKDAHTITVQAASRIDETTLAVQIYHSTAVPTPSASFDLGAYLPITTDAYGRFCTSILLRPFKALTPDLSPLHMAADLFGVAGVQHLTRSEGRRLVKRFAAEDESMHASVPSNVKIGRRGLVIPSVKLTIVGHYLPADFCRINGCDFLEGLKGEDRPRESKVIIRCRKLLQWKEEHGRSLNPILEYAFLNDDFYQILVETRDTITPYGPSSLDGFSKTFLGLGKSELLSLEEKQDMIRTVHERTADVYGYAAVDAVNTLLVFEQMQLRDREIYKAFDFADSDIPPLRATLGSRVSTFILKTTGPTASSAQALPSGRSLQALMAKGGMNLFEEHPEISRFGTQTGKVHGGLLYSRSPTKFWHESPGMLRDVDMAGCYNKITSRLTVFWGRPIVYEPGARPLTLRQAVRLVQRNADPNAWMLRVSGAITKAPNALIPSTDNAITAANYRVRMARGKKRQASQRAFHLEALRDPASVKGTSGSRLYASVVESGVVTWAVWLMIQALPASLRTEYEQLNADCLVFYPRSMVARNGAEFDKLTERHRNANLPWTAALDLEGMTLAHTEKLDADYICLAYPLGEFAQVIGENRKKAKAQYGEKSGPDVAWKVHANAMYGVLCSTYLPVNNFLAGNQITAQARSEAFAMSQSLNAMQTITDGCTYRIDQIPSCSFARCLKIKPDYPIRRAEDGDGIPFVDPATIPQDNGGFTEWYRAHVRRFFKASEPEYVDLFDAHELDHKKTSLSKSIAFDALACDGSGNYMKLTRNEAEGWQMEDFAARSYKKDSKEVLESWMVKTYSEDHLAQLTPVAEDMELLSFKRAAQVARKALDAGVPEVYFPLGLATKKVMNYRAIKASAFVFETPEQRAAIVKQMHKFEDKTYAGLEAMSLRRSYNGRREGSLTDVAETMYQLIRSGDDNLTKALNLHKWSPALFAATVPRAADIERRKAEAEANLRERIDVRNIDPAALTTAFVVRAEDIRVFTDDAVTLTKTRLLSFSQPQPQAQLMALAA